MAVLNAGILAVSLFGMEKRGAVSFAATVLLTAAGGYSLRESLLWVCSVLPRVLLRYWARVRFQPHPKEETSSSDSAAVLGRAGVSRGGIRSRQAAAEAFRACSRRVAVFFGAVAGAVRSLAPGNIALKRSAIALPGFITLAVPARETGMAGQRVERGSGGLRGWLLGTRPPAEMERADSGFSAARALG